MFKYLGIVAGKPTAQISEDNLQISWYPLDDGTIPEPPWSELYMERYDEEFRQAKFDYAAMKNTFDALQSFGIVDLNKHD